MDDVMHVSTLAADRSATLVDAAGQKHEALAAVQAFCGQFTHRPRPSDLTYVTLAHYIPAPDNPAPIGISTYRTRHNAEHVRVCPHRNMRELRIGNDGDRYWCVLRAGSVPDGVFLCPRGRMNLSPRSGRHEAVGQAVCVSLFA
jgi:hypothetical protein